ncbi:uncharacterized protein LOC123548475 [Mercenaria mercenaria]|uniref:uncharacterized protein LOC123548475 n=1 Tax=Mercenaria mercenaria TaxID=6596 RepID=UPI00234E70B9|nr:uncharacterized protein LOC123548475 [Mercenaria mercenaria]
MENFSHVRGVTSDENESSFVYDILSEGHSQAISHRHRSYSLHSSRYSTRDNGLKKRNHQHRRMSLPPTEMIVPKDRSCVEVEAKHTQAKGHKVNEAEMADSMRDRRARSFKERTEKCGNNHRRVRSFKTTSKGLVNQGDTSKIKKDTKYDDLEASNIRVDATLQTFNNCVIPQLITSKCSVDQNDFRVLMSGARGVGKSSIIDQFMTSEFLWSGSFNISQSEGERTVTLQVDGEESTLEFVQSEDFQDQEESFQIDGFVVVYCITERATFEIAIDLLKQIRDEVGSNKAIILVGNKSDLVRRRTISQEEGRSAADAYGCKYIELSAALNHHVDELLVGIHKQIKLKSEADSEELESKTPKAKERKRSFKRTKRFLEKVFLGHSGKDKKTENLYVE